MIRTIRSAAPKSTARRACRTISTSRTICSRQRTVAPPSRPGPTITSGSLATGDSASWSQTFDTADIGSGKTLTPSGTVTDGNSGNNYDVTFATVSTGAITAESLTVTGITASNKVYDGGTTATINASAAALVGVRSGDDVSLVTSGASGAFSDKPAGNDKTVSISGLTLSGDDTDNYSLTQPTTTADITTKGVTVTGSIAENKAYDGTTAATMDFSGASIVGAIGALTALDYLGYGLPAPTPSWGEMIDQALASNNRDKLWLSVAPFSAISITLLLVTLIGESVREAFDPKQYARYR